MPHSSRHCRQLPTTLLVALLAASITHAAQLDRARFTGVSQSSDAAAPNTAAAALDRSTSTSSFTQNLPASFWQAELGRPYWLDRIEVVAPPTGSAASLGGLTLRLFNLDDQIVFQATLTDPGAGGTWTTNLPANTRGRILRLGLDGAQTNAAGNYQVGLAEVRLFGDLTLPYGPAPFSGTTNPSTVAQSSEYGGFPAANAVDGDTANFTHTANLTNSYWIADLLSPKPIDRVELVNRVDCCDSRFAGLVLRILNAASNSVASVTLTNPGPGGTYTYLPPPGSTGRYVKVGLENGQLNGGGNFYVTLAEARVFSGSTNWLASSTTLPAVTNNLASFKPSYMVRLDNSVPAAANANDDNLATQTRTTTATVDGYWETDLGATYAVYGVRSIAASGIATKLTNTTCRLYDAAHESIHAQRLTGGPEIFDSDLNGPFFARYIRVGLEDKQRTDPAGGIEWHIGFREVEVFGRPTNAIGIVNFTASAPQIATPQPVALNWSVEDVRRVEIHPGLGSVGASTATSGLGAVSVTVSNSTEYILLATNRAGLFTRGVSVLVGTNPLPVRISEIVAENQHSLKDGDGDASDWIELRNPGNTAVNLAGYGLSDDPAVPMKWVFPTTLLAPHSTLIVFASGRDTPLDAAGNLHMRFKLAKHGGTVVLTATNGITTLDNLTYPELDTDLAYGRDLAGDWTFLEPTPGAVNAAPAYAGWLPQLDWSHARGFCETPFTLTLTNHSPGATVLYSLDGSEPSLIYSDGIPISSTKAARAKVVRPGYKSSRSQTKTFIFLDDVIANPNLSATIKNNAAYAPRLRPGLLALPTISLCVPGQPEYWEQPGSVEVIWPDGTQGVQVNCGVARFGNAWTKFAKRSIRIKCRAAYGESRLNAPLFNGFDRGVLAKSSFDEIELRSGSQDMVERGFYMAGRFVEDSMLDMGSLNPHGRFVHVYVNGVYWGQYDAREPLAEHFLADYLGGAPEAYVAVRGNDNVGDNFALGTPEPPNRASWEAVRAYRTNYNLVRAYLDLPHLIDFMLLWNYGNSESEYRAGGPVAAGSGFKFWIADADGFLRTSAMGLNRTVRNGPGDVLSGLLAENHSDFKTLLADRIYQHYYNNGALTPARNTARLAARMQEINDSMIPECARWGYRTPANWVSAASNIYSNLFPSRTTQLIGYYRSAGWLPAFDPPAFNQFGGLVTNGFQPTLTSSSGTIYYTVDGTDPRLAGGGIAPNALIWNPGNLTITNDLTLNVRVRTPGGLWSALAQPQYLIGVRQPPTVRELVISEIHYHPAGSDEFEYIELANLGTNLLDLSGVSLSNAVRFIFPAGFSLPPGGFVVVTENPTAFSSRYQTNSSPWYWPGLSVAGPWVGALDNSGEVVTLVGATGVVLSSVPYKTSGDWPERADGQGSSLELRTFPTVTNAPAEVPAILASGRNWRSSSLFHGSPGRLDPFAKTVRINEILAHTDAVGDWVELANVSDQPADLTACSLTDNLDLPLRYAFTTGTIIPPGERLVLSQAELGFGLSELGDDLTLLQVGGSNILRFLDSVDLPASNREESLGNFTRSDGEIDFTELRVATPGAANGLPRIGPVVISELMLTPAPGWAQFIELTSVTNGPTPLHHPLHPTNTWQLAGIGAFNFPSGIVLQSCSSLIICATNPAAFRSQYGLSPSVPVFGPWTGTLDPDGESLKLLRPGNPETNNFVPYYRVDHIAFRTNAPWLGAGAGFSLERTPVEGYGNDPAGWRASTLNGTPGTPRPNRPPMVQFSGGTNLAELTPMTMNVAAVDLDFPWQSASLAAVQLPFGASFNSSTGEWQWTPTEAQGPGLFAAAFAAHDNAVCGALWVTNSIAIQVDEVNQPPTWLPLPAVRIPANAVHSFAVTASDPDLPAPSLRYTAFNLPAGFSINPVTGVISGSAATQGLFVATLEVTDDQWPPLAAQTNLMLHLVEPLAVKFREEPGQLQLSFPGTAGGTYRVEFTESLTSPDWRTFLTTNPPPTPTIAVFMPAPGPTTNRFYRVQWEP